MKKFLFFLFIATGIITACEEVEEVSKYDNWQLRNEAFIDSIRTLAGENYVATEKDADNMEIDKLYAIQTNTSTTSGEQYVYCKKLVKNLNGERPNYVGYHSKINSYYYGTLINGEEFDGCFIGYSATDTDIPNPPEKAPTNFDETISFNVSGVIPGWMAALQFMRTGERWMLYIPYQSAYGTSGTGAIPSYSVLTFDVILDSFAE